MLIISHLLLEAEHTRATSDLLINIVLLIRIIIMVLLRDFDSFIWTLFVDIHDMLLSFLHEYASNVPDVACFRYLFYFVGDFGVLGKYVVEEKLL